jgi:7-cyano-7-deazaguanine synthase
MPAGNKGKLVVLATGGIDSSTMLLFYRHGDFKLFPIFIDYGQLSARREYQALEKILNHLKITAPVYRCSIEDLGTIVKSQLTNVNSSKPYHAHRNLLLLTVGAMYASKIGSMAVALGIVGGYSAPFPDCSQSFIRSAERLLSTSINNTIRIYTPLFEFMKSDVIRLGISKGFRYDLTYSCYSGNAIHCGSCRGCRERQLAFKDANIKDDLKYGKGKVNRRRRKTP